MVCPTQYPGSRDQVSSVLRPRQTETGCRPRRCLPRHRSGPSVARCRCSATAEPVLTCQSMLALPGSLFLTAPNAAGACDPCIPEPPHRERPQPMPQEAPVTVTRRVHARLLSSDTCDIDVPTQLHDDAVDPYAVTATFLLAEDLEVEWVLARDLLGDGLQRQSGDGDVVLRPSTGADSTDVELVVSVPRGHARVTLPAETVAAFLRRATPSCRPAPSRNTWISTPPSCGSCRTKRCRSSVESQRFAPTVRIQRHPHSTKTSPGDVNRSHYQRVFSLDSGLRGGGSLESRTPAGRTLCCPPWRAHAVRLDLRHLTFCDTGGCWRLLRFERDARLSGYRTSIHGAKLGQSAPSWHSSPVRTSPPLREEDRSDGLGSPSLRPTLLGTPRKDPR